MISNEKVVNNKVVELIDFYNFYFSILSMQHLYFLFINNFILEGSKSKKVIQI